MEAVPGAGATVGPVAFYGVLGAILSVGVPLMLRP